MLVDQSTRGDPKKDALMQDLNFRNCSALKKTRSKKFWVGITHRGRKFIVNPPYFKSTIAFKPIFLRTAARTPNVEYNLTASMKKELKVIQKQCVTNEQVVRIEKKIRKYKKNTGFHATETTWKGFRFKGSVVEVDRPWIITNFKTRAPEFYNILIQCKDEEAVFEVPAGCSLQTKSPKIALKDITSTHTENPKRALKDIISVTIENPSVMYLQGDKNSCIFSSLASALHYMGDIYASEYIIQRKDESINCLKGKGRMHFCKDILLGHHKRKHEKKLKYTVEEWKGSPEFDIFCDISPFPTVCRLIDGSFGTGHCVTVCNKWIFDSNFENAFALTRKALNDICMGEFRGVSHAIRAVPPKVVKMKLSI